MNRIDEIRERLAKATPGLDRASWEPFFDLVRWGVRVATGHSVVGYIYARLVVIDDSDDAKADAYFIAHAPDDIAFLLGELDAIETARKLAIEDAELAEEKLRVMGEQHTAALEEIERLDAEDQALVPLAEVDRLMKIEAAARTLRNAANELYTTDQETARKVDDLFAALQRKQVAE